MEPIDEFFVSMPPSVGICRRGYVGPVLSSSASARLVERAFSGDAAGAVNPRGVNALSFDNGGDGDRRRKSRDAPDSETSRKPRAKTRKGDSPELGQALRSVYDRTLNEQIPPEMLDLLGKLG
jgi:hypothetical protein